MIDYVRDQSKQEKVSYIGHSQGTTEMFLALGLNQDFWKQRINLFIATAPVILPNRHSKLFSFGSQFEKVGEKTLAAAGILELFGQDWSKVQGTVRVLIPGISEAVLS